MRLITYMKERGLDDEGFASLIGSTSARAVKKWKYGETVPRLPELVRIEAVTGGAVKPSDFLPAPASPQEGEAA